MLELFCQLSSLWFTEIGNYYVVIYLYKQIVHNLLYYSNLYVCYNLLSFLSLSWILRRKRILLLYILLLILFLERVAHFHQMANMLYLQMENKSILWMLNNNLLKLPSIAQIELTMLNGLLIQNISYVVSIEIILLK